MHLDGRTDKRIEISEEEYEMLLMYKMQAETSQINKNAQCIEGCERALSN